MEREISKIARKMVKKIDSKEKVNKKISETDLSSFLGIQKFNFGEIEKENKIGVATKYGTNAFFSFSYNPGATNFHICIKIIGLPKKIAEKKATFK